MPVIKDLGCMTSIEVINQTVALSGKFVIDAGCGNMAFSRPLVEHGAKVLAIDPDPVQARANLEAEPLRDLEFVETGAESLPVDDRTVDGVFFSYSLHHIPQEIFPEVFAEVFRVLKPEGFLFVIEPTSCPLNEVMKLFHDEDEERAAAQRALDKIAMPAFKTVNVVAYHSFSKYESFEEFAAHFSSRSFNTYRPADVRTPEVRRAFEAHAPDYRFISPKQAMILRDLRTP